MNSATTFPSNERVNEEEETFFQKKKKKKKKKKKLVCVFEYINCVDKKKIKIKIHFTSSISTQH